MTDALDQFAAFLAARGLLVARIEADGTLHRCPVENGKAGRKDGSYIFHPDVPQAGGCQNFRDGLGWQDWCSAIARDVALAPEQRAAQRARIEAIRRDRETDEAKRHADAARRASRLLNASRLAGNEHPYLLRKGVNAYGIRQLQDQLVIPMRDTAGQLHSLQFIGPDGGKRFLTGGRKKACYYAIGRPLGVLCLVEGYATGASVYVSTGYAVAICFDAGNLGPVAKALRAKFPSINMVIVADNDIGTAGNPGVSQAIAAARTVRGEVAVPHFGGLAP